MNNFFVALFAFLVIPTLVSRVLRISRFLPLVFLQLMFGVALNASGVTAMLKASDIDLLQGGLASALQGLGWLGVALLIAMTGSEVAPDPQSEPQARWRVALISILGFAGTWAAGGSLAYGLALMHPALIGPLATPWIFGIGVGLALAVTALPVLVVIVRQAGLNDHPVARLAVQCAMLDDLWLWLGMTVVLAYASSATTSPLMLMAGLSGYLLAMLGVIRPLLRRWYGRPGAMNELDALMVAVATILISAAVTGMIGLHSLFGAFMAGAILPREALRNWREPLQQLLHMLLLPAFFILTGLKLVVDLHSPMFWQLASVLTIGAVAGKMLVAAVGARLSGLPWKTGFALGSLMQCKGLMELVAISILLDVGIIGKEIFSALAMMAVVSTFVTLPLARLLFGRVATAPAPCETDPEPAPAPQLGRTGSLA